MPPPRPIKTPCVQVCAIDEASGLCLGCFRTLSEIAGWSRLTDADRDRVIGEAPARRSLVAPERLGGA